MRNRSSDKLANRRSCAAGGVLSGPRGWLAILGASLALLPLGLTAQPAGTAEATAAADAGHAPPAKVRVGVLNFGTVNWELDVIRHHGVDTVRGIVVERVPLASKSALSLALEAGEIDVMVGDWLWVVGKRQAGGGYSFVPYSLAVGSLMVMDPQVRALTDLRGRTIGVSGGPRDKSWILLRAYARRVIRADLASATDQLFAPSPLLGDLVAAGELDAVVANWNYGVRLRERGLRTLIEVADVLPELGIAEPIPLLGWIFADEWADRHERDLKAFLAASYAAKALLAQSDQEWQRLRPLLGLPSGASLAALREGYRAGIPQRFGDEERGAVRRALQVLVEEAGGPRALGLRSSRLPGGIFWSGFEVSPAPGG
jgi:NitT/TauT family transport system substrate-binding protein